MSTSSSIRAAQPVVASVAADERPFAKRACDGVDRADEPRRTGLVVAGDDREKERGVEIFLVGAADVASRPLRVATRLDELPDARQLAAPALGVARQDASIVKRADGLKRDRAHHLR